MSLAAAMTSKGCQQTPPHPGNVYERMMQCCLWLCAFSCLDTPVRHIGTRSAEKLCHVRQNVYPSQPLRTARARGDVLKLSREVYSGGLFGGGGGHLRCIADGIPTLYEAFPCKRCQRAVLKQCLAFFCVLIVGPCDHALRLVGISATRNDASH